MLQKFSFDAELIVSVNNIPFLIVAEGNHVVVNFKDHQALEQLLKVGAAKAESPARPEKAASGGPLKKLNDINGQVRDLGLVVEIRVNNKIYVVLGAGNSASIKAAAIFGKIGSFFSR